MREIELKLEVGADSLEGIRRCATLRRHGEGRALTHHLRSVYFDTENLDLAAAGIALRIRQVGHAFVQTVKCDAEIRAGRLERTELEAPVPGEEPELERISDLALRARIEQAKGTRILAPVIETDVRRLQRNLRVGSSLIEFALDEGLVRTHAAEAPIRELELELLEGRASDLYRVALEIQQSADLRPSLLSKDARGRALLTGQRPAPRCAGRVKVAHDASTDDLLAVTFGSCLDQILANRDLAHEGHDPEGVHQMRVGVRRMRSALAMFSDILPTDATRALRDELRWLAGHLGTARDWDVFLEETVEPLQRAFSTDPGLKRLRDETRARRDGAYALLRGALDDPRTMRLLLHLGSWVAGREWRDQPLSAQSARIFAPAREIAAERLDRRARRARRLGRRVADCSLEERHDLRLRVKKLRYASEFLRDLYSETRRARRYLRRLSQLQDTLGTLNDSVTAARLLGELLEGVATDASGDLHQAAGFVGGWTARSTQDQARDLPIRWKRFARLEPFWARP